MAKNLKGDYTPAVIAAVYGNRHYDDALLQMKDILTEQGYVVIAGGHFWRSILFFRLLRQGARMRGIRRLWRTLRQNAVHF